MPQAIEGLQGVVDYKRKAINTALLRTQCPMCKGFTTIEVPSQGLYNFSMLGQYVQTAFPSLSATEREQLLTGYCQSCWDMLFKLSILLGYAIQRRGALVVKEKITITMQCPKKSFGLDISQIENALSNFLHLNLKRQKVDCGSGRSISLKREKL